MRNGVVIKLGCGRNMQGKWIVAKEIVLHVARIGASDDTIRRVAEMAYKLQKVKNMFDVIHDCDTERSKIINAAEIITEHISTCNEVMKQLQRYISAVDCEKVKEVAEIMRSMINIAHEKLVLALDKINIGDIAKYLDDAKDLMSVAVDVVLYHLQYTTE